MRLATLPFRRHKKNQRNVFSRAFHAQSDKDAIAAWKQHLNRILITFNVCSVVSDSYPLTTSFQTELSINTHVTVMRIERHVLLLKLPLLASWTPAVLVVRLPVSNLPRSRRHNSRNQSHHRRSINSWF